MMKLILYIQIMAFTIFCLQSCRECSESDDCHCVIEIVNNSNEDIWIGETGSQHSGIICQQGLIRINSESSFIHEQLRSCWESNVDNLYNGAVVFYFFEENYHLTHTDCDSIELNQSVMERREYTVEDLNAIDWTVEYP